MHSTCPAAYQGNSQLTASSLTGPSVFGAPIEVSKASIASEPMMSVTLFRSAHSFSARPTPTGDAKGPAWGAK